MPQASEQPISATAGSHRAAPQHDHVNLPPRTTLQAYGDAVPRALADDVWILIQGQAWIAVHGGDAHSAARQQEAVEKLKARFRKAIQRMATWLHFRRRYV